MEHHVLQSKGLLKNLGTPTIIKKQGLLNNSELYKNMNPAYNKTLSLLVEAEDMHSAPRSTRPQHHDTITTRPGHRQPNRANRAAMRKVFGGARPEFARRQNELLQKTKREVAERKAKRKAQLAADFAERRKPLYKQLFNSIVRKFRGR